MIKSVKDVTQEVNRYNEYPYQQLTSDQIEGLGFDWCFSNDLPSNLPDGTVMMYNMDKKGGKGTHWTCFALRKPTIYYYDPFGVYINGNPPKPLSKWGLSHGYDEIFANEFDNQHLKSWLCGYYSLYMAHQLSKHVDHLSHNYFDGLIKRSFTRKPSNRNVNRVIHWSRKMGLL